jgi:hypothetical protein
MEAEVVIRGPRDECIDASREVARYELSGLRSAETGAEVPCWDGRISCTADLVAGTKLDLDLL